MTNYDGWPAPGIEWRGDGVVKFRDNEYRIHKAWTESPHVFVRYTSRGRNCERKLATKSMIALRVAIRFRNEVRKEQKSLAPPTPVW